VVDLSVALRTPGQRNDLGAKTAVAKFFGLKLQKSKKISTTNWAMPRLNEKQILYAADDAQVALRVYRHWISLGNKLPPKRSNCRSQPKPVYPSRAAAMRRLHEEVCRFFPRWSRRRHALAAAPMAAPDWEQRIAACLSCHSVKGAATLISRASPASRPAICTTSCAISANGHRHYPMMTYMVATCRTPICARLPITLRPSIRPIRPPWRAAAPTPAPPSWRAAKRWSGKVMPAKKSRPAWPATARH
jgi:hypothetical protein